MWLPSVCCCIVRDPLEESAALASVELVHPTRVFSSNTPSLLLVHNTLNKCTLDGLPPPSSNQCIVNRDPSFHTETKYFSGKKYAFLPNQSLFLPPQKLPNILETFSASQSLEMSSREIRNGIIPVKLAFGGEPRFMCLDFQLKRLNF